MNLAFSLDPVALRTVPYSTLGMGWCFCLSKTHHDLFSDRYRRGHDSDWFRHLVQGRNDFGFGSALSGQAVRTHRPPAHQFSLEQQGFHFARPGPANLDRQCPPGHVAEKGIGLVGIHVQLRSIFLSRHERPDARLAFLGDLEFPTARSTRSRSSIALDSAAKG